MFTNTRSQRKYPKAVVVTLLAVAAISLLAPAGAASTAAAPASAQSFTYNVDDPQDLHPITRGELAKKVSNAAHFHDDPGPQLFQDVPPTNVYYRYVNRLANRGAVGGFPCGTVPEEPCVEPDNLPYYRPDVNALRGQAAKIVAVAAGFTDEPTGQTFQDIPPGSTFYVWVEQLASRGIVSGFPCGEGVGPCVEPDNLPYYRPFDALAKHDAQLMVHNTFHNDGLQDQE